VTDCNLFTEWSSGQPEKWHVAQQIRVARKLFQTRAG